MSFLPGMVVKDSMIAGNTAALDDLTGKPNTPSSMEELPSEYL